MLKIVFLVSIGRSGSTWLAKEIAKEMGAVNIGENRYFWDSVFNSKAEVNKEELIRQFLLRKGVTSSIILDKSTNIYQYINRLDELNVNHDLVFLTRNKKSIAKSKDQFVKRVFSPKRIKMRVQKYYIDYGWKFFIPILQRWRFILVPFGLSAGKAFNTQKAKGLAKISNDEEFKSYQHVLSQNSSSPIIDYDNFEKSIYSLKMIGLTEKSIKRIQANFRDY